MCRPACIPLLGALCLLPATAVAFNWNGKTGTHELDTLDGQMRISSGHPLATARAFDLAVEQARVRQDGGAALSAMQWLYGDDEYDDLKADDSDAMQTVLFGSWLNEVRTSLDMGGEGGSGLILGWAARFMGWRYGNYLGGREHSDRWNREEGYTSSNYQHSMMVSNSFYAPTQNDVFDLVQEYRGWALTAGLLNLMFALKEWDETSEWSDAADLNWISGLRYLGSIFHIIEDSSVTCDEVSSSYVPNCIPGDGHGLVAMTAAGRLQVVALSDDAYYQRPEATHGLLDDLYREGQIEEIYGSFDPATVTSQILVQTALAVHSAIEELRNISIEDDEFYRVAFRRAREAAERINDQILTPRYAAPQHRRSLPALPGSVDGSSDEERSSAGLGGGGGGSVGEPEAGLSCSSAPSTRAHRWWLALVPLILLARRHVVIAA